MDQNTNRIKREIQNEPLESLHLAEGARDQSSSARRGLPSKGEALALQHQPALALTLTLLFALAADRWLTQKLLLAQNSFY